MATSDEEPGHIYGAFAKACHIYDNLARAKHRINGTTAEASRINEIETRVMMWTRDP